MTSHFWPEDSTNPCIILISLLCFSSDHGAWALKWRVMTQQGPGLLNRCIENSCPGELLELQRTCREKYTVLSCYTLRLLTQHKSSLSELVVSKSQFLNQQSEFYKNDHRLEWWFINLSIIDEKTLAVYRTTFSTFPSVLFFFFFSGSRNRRVKMRAPGMMKLVSTSLGELLW